MTPFLLALSAAAFCAVQAVLWTIAHRREVRYQAVVRRIRGEA